MGKFIFTGFLIGTLIRPICAQEVGIGTTIPAARLDVQAPAAYTGDMLRILRGAGTYMIIKNNGKVGIGTAAPFHKLDVVGGGIIARVSAWNAYPRGAADNREAFRATGTTSDYIISIQDGTGRVQHYWNAKPGSGSSTQTYLVSGEAAGKILFSPPNDPWLTFNWAPSGTAGGNITWQPQMVLRQNGNVGIGTTAPDPDNKLEVNGVIEIQADNVDNKLRFHDPYNYWYSMGIDRSDGGKFKINYGGNIGDYAHFTLTSNGRVGIGTPNPLCRLHVANDGMIYAQGTFNAGTAIPAGAKTAFIWNPRTGAVRAGRVTGNQWDPSNVGGYSAAFGHNVKASGGFSTVGGGHSNTASGYSSTVGGGFYNTASGSSSTVGGGLQNHANNTYSTVGGGFYNTASGSYSTVGGGATNTASGYYCTVGGGDVNTASGYSSTVGGGRSNTAGGGYSTVGGGYVNTASGSSSTVSGGYHNTASGSSSTVGGGYWNTASGWYSTVSGGYRNVTGGYGCTVGGGESDTASGWYSTVSGGIVNTAGNNYSTVGGGTHNTAVGVAGTVGGGYVNTASGYSSTVGGGYYNTASGSYSTVGGGSRNTAGGSYSWAGGMGMKLGATAHYTFAWGYNAAVTPPTITATHAFLIGPNGTHYQVGINTSTPVFALSLPNSTVSGVGRARAQGWFTYSDARVKTAVATISGRDALQKIARLRPIHYYHHSSRWTPEGVLELLDTGAYQYGFLAQELAEVVPEVVEVPADPEKDLYGVNYDGLIPILTAALQAQQKTIATQQKAITSLEQRLTEQQQANARLQSTVTAHAQRLATLEAMLNSASGQ